MGHNVYIYVDIYDFPLVWDVGDDDIMKGSLEIPYS